MCTCAHTLARKTESRISCIQNKTLQAGQVMHIFTLSTQEVQAGRSLSSKSVWSTYQVPSQQGLHSETLKNKLTKKAYTMVDLHPHLKSSPFLWSFAVSSLCYPHHQHLHHLKLPTLQPQPSIASLPFHFIFYLSD